MELEEAQAEAEALLDAEARGTGTVDARAEVRAPAGTAGYTQRAPRPRPGYDRQRGGGRRGGGRRFPRRQSSHDVPKISDLLKEGQEILVQIAKEPIGKKGARITSHIALPGRFLVYMPTVNHTGVSRKIASDEERQRLKRIVMSERENGHGGFIVRTAAQNASEDELRADIRFLKGLWNDIKTRAEASKPPALIYHDLNVVERVLRDQVTSDFSVIWVDTEPEYERILRFFNRFQPGLVKRVKLYTKETPLFEQFGLAEEMNKALKSKVWLKSGGYIVINQTEALVAIDINTGKYVGKTSRLEDTIVKTNVDAVKEIVRQIRLRDLGGIIIIDFIDMDERRNRQRVMQALEEELRHDRAPVKGSAVQRFRPGRHHPQTGEAIARTHHRRALSLLPVDGLREVADHGSERDLRGDAQDREASGARRRNAARASRRGQGVESQQRPPAERDGRTDQAHHHREKRSRAASGAVRYQLSIQR